MRCGVFQVKRIQEQVLAWKASGSKTAMCTARSQYQSISFQTLTYKRKLHQISLDLPHVLSLDTDRRVVHVEPNVSIGQLNDYLIAKGWTLPVVPELDDLTIGGLVMGGGIETTSHKYGLFQYICRSYEVGQTIKHSFDMLIILYLRYTLKESVFNCG